MPEGIIIHVYVSTSDFKQVQQKIMPHFTSTSFSFHKRNKLIMSRVIVQHADGKRDPTYYGFDGIDKVIKKYGDKDKYDSVFHEH